MALSEQGVGVSNFDLLNIQALNTSTTGLPGDGAFAWSVRMGYGDDQVGCTDCGVFRTNGFVGYAFGNGANLIIPYALGGGQVQTPFEASGIANVQAKGGLLSNRGELVGLHLEGGIKLPLDGRETSRSLRGSGVQVGAVPPWRLSASVRIREERSVVSLVYLGYW